LLHTILDLLKKSKCHLIRLGAAAASGWGTEEMQEHIKQNIKTDHIQIAIGELVKRNIVSGTFWIIGFPGETQESIEHTLKQAAHTKFLMPPSRIGRLPPPPHLGHTGLPRRRRARLQTDPRLRRVG
jgi:radical SAM superfamily enzyme YgiQ (UPF0313 family)